MGVRPDADDELELLERWRGGDQDAGRRLFEGNFPALFGFFRRRFPDGAEDLTQRTLLLCVEGQGRQRAGSTFRAFLFGIARNVALQEIEARARQRRDDRDPAEVAEGGGRARPSTWPSAPIAGASSGRCAGCRSTIRSCSSSITGRA